MANQSGRRRLLEHHIAAYGADAAKWPPEARRASLKDSGPDDGAIYDDARDLDRLLDVATRPHVPAGAAERAIASILAAGARQAGSANVVSVDFIGRGQERRKALTGGHMAGLAALAASLVLGVYVGSAGLAKSLVPSEVASLSSGAADFDIVEHVLADLEEDLG